MKICPVCSREFPPEHTLCPHDGVQLVALATGAGSRPEDLVGQVVDGRYRVERIVGKGGMGTVYAVRHVVVGKSAAMKVLRQGVERSDGVLQRFVREAQTANALRSRHIAEMTDFGQLANGCFYVVMELLEGQDLTHAMRKGRLAFREMVHVFIQVAETLSHAHALGIVHRDLKPDNVFLVREGDDPNFVKLLDFGIAKVLGDTVSGLTETGVILGTPYYMAPEQARAEAVDHRADIYALGVMMYRAFTGKLPFVADSMMGVLTRHLTEAPPLPSSIAPIDGGVERVILRCLEKAPARRFQSMQELADALRTVGPNAVPAMRDDPTVPERAPSAPVPEPTHGGRGPAHFPAQPTPTPAPTGGYRATPQPAPSGSFAPRTGSGAQAAKEAPPSGAAPPGAELGTSRAFAASRGVTAPSTPRAMLVGGAITLLGVGAALAVGVFWAASHGLLRGPTAPAASAGSAAPLTPAAAASPAAQAASAASVAAQVPAAPAPATAAPTASASASASPSTSASPSAAALDPAHPRPGGPRPPAIGPAPAPPKRPPTNEIRSPFD